MNIEEKKIFWISSYPKSGNTWLRLILCGLFFTDDGKIDNFAILKNIPKFDIINNFSFIKKISHEDYYNIFDNKEYDENSLILYSKYWIEAQKRIKIRNGNFAFFKTHNARVKINNNFYTNSRTTAGFIYISRDPRDIVVSYSDHMSKDLNFTTNYILNGQIMGKEKNVNIMPEITLNWGDHYLSWKKFQNVPNLFLRYEDLLISPEKELQKIINFFKDFYKINISNKENKIKNIINTTSFKHLKNSEEKIGFNENLHSKKFFRVGKKNQWKNKLQKNYIQSIENKFKIIMDELNYNIIND